MSDKNNDTKFNKDGKNFFEIMDEIINQLNNTKRLFYHYDINGNDNPSYSFYYYL